MRRIRIKKKKIDGIYQYLIQKRKYLLFWVTVEVLRDDEMANDALSEMTQGYFYRNIKNGYDKSMKIW